MENKTTLTENQKISKFAVWLIDKFDQESEKQKKNKAKSRDKPHNSTLNVNDDWSNQPKNDEPFHGTVTLPEGME